MPVSCAAIWFTASASGADCTLGLLAVSNRPLSKLLAADRLASGLMGCDASAEPAMRWNICNAEGRDCESDCIQSSMSCAMSCVARKANLCHCYLYGAMQPVEARLQKTKGVYTLVSVREASILELR